MTHGWKFTVSFGQWQFGERENTKERPPHADQALGGVAIAQIADDEFVIAGQYARLRIDSAVPQGSGSMIARDEEGRFDAGGDDWLMERNWNGDQVDWGLNLPAHPTVLKVRMGRY